MWFWTLFNSPGSHAARARVRKTRQDYARQRPAARRLRVESLEDRVVFSFSPAVMYPVATNSAIVTADFNGDDFLDLAVANIDSIRVLPGNGDGTFGAPVTSVTSAAGGLMVTADFNGDGKMDLVTTRDDTARIFLGNGDGTFQAPSPVGYGGSASTVLMAVATGDLDRNGTKDLVITSTTYETGDDATARGGVSVLLGKGDGTFLPHVGRGTIGYSPVSVAITELDGDGNLDLVIGDSDYVGSVFLGNGDGSFGDSTYQTTMLNAFGAAGVADFNGDGWMDVATNYAGTFAILTGSGDGTFQHAGQFAAGGIGVTIADFNGDGKNDLAATSPGWVSIALGHGDGAFAPPLGFAIDDLVYPSNLIAADFNADALPDLAFNDYPTGVSVLINDGVWENMPPPPPPPTPSLQIGDAWVTEGNTGTVGAAFTVTLSAASAEPVTIAYATADGTATAGSDYAAASGTLTFAPGETSKTVTVLVNGDRLVEPNETFVVNLSGASNATIADGQGVGTILDDEPRISIGDVTKKEGNGKKTTLFTFTLTLSAAYDQPVTVSYRTVDGTATTGNSDYVAKTGTLTFAPGETTKTISISVKGDSKREASEVFYLDLFANSSNSQFNKSRGIGTILNDD